MPWNEADRTKYEVIRERYSSDMLVAENALISTPLSPPKRRRRKPTNLLATPISPSSAKRSPFQPNHTPPRLRSASIVQTSSPPDGRP